MGIDEISFEFPKIEIVSFFYGGSLFRIKEIAAVVTAMSVQVVSSKFHLRAARGKRLQEPKSPFL